jgi:plasmid stabilization system protein ParE
MSETNKRYQVIISDRATELLVQHVRFLSQVSIQAADQLRINIVEAAQSLQEFPHRHAWLVDPSLPVNKYRKLLVDSRYLLIYQIKDDIVYIDFMVDCRQDYPWLLK